jgi:hypothetical protein
LYVAHVFSASTSRKKPDARCKTGVWLTTANNN